MAGEILTVALERQPVNGVWAALGAIGLLVLLCMWFGKRH